MSLKSKCDKHFEALIHLVSANKIALKFDSETPTDAQFNFSAYIDSIGYIGGKLKAVNSEFKHGLKVFELSDLGASETRKWNEAIKIFSHVVDQKTLVKL